MTTNSNRSSTIVVSLACLAPLLGGCDKGLDDPRAAGGSGVDVPNSFQARLLADDPCRKSGALVRIRPSEWTPLDSLAPATWNSVATDSGALRIEIPPTHPAWTLEVQDSSGICGILREIRLLPGGTLADSLRLLRLQPTGTVSGTVSTPTGTGNIADLAIVVPGIDMLVRPDTSGSWSSRPLPPGAIKPEAAFESATSSIQPLAEVVVASGVRTTTPPVVITPSPPARSRTTSGRLHLSDGKVASGGTITLSTMDSGVSETRRFSVDDSGRYAFVLPDSGKWRLQARSGNQSSSDSIQPADLDSSHLAATILRLQRIDLGPADLRDPAAILWEPRGPGKPIPSAAQAYYLDPSKVWLGYSDGSLYLTTDATSSTPQWIRLDSASDGHGGTFDGAPNRAIIGISPLVDNDGYSALVAFADPENTGRMWKVEYNRGGLTWTDLGDILPFSGIRSVAQSSWTGIVYLDSDDQAAYSADGGTTFQTAPFANNPYEPADSTITHLTTVGNHFQASLAAIGTREGEIWIASPVNPPSHPASFRRISSGSWGSLPAQPVLGLTFDVRDTSGNTLYASIGGSIDQALWVTKDGGESWHSLYSSGLAPNEGGSGTITGSISCPPILGARTLYISTDRGSFRSDDGGTTWRASN